MRFYGGYQRFEWSDLNPVNLIRQYRVSMDLAEVLAEVKPSADDINRICNVGGDLYPTEGEAFVDWVSRSIRFWRTPWKTS